MVSAAASVGSRPIPSSAAPAGSQYTTTLPPFFQPSAFPSVGTPMPPAPTYTTSLPMTSLASKNLFSTPPGYIPTSLGMPPHMMNHTWPQQQDAVGLTAFAHATPPSPQKTLPMVAYQQLPQQQVGNPQASISAPSSTTTPSQFDPSAVWAMMNVMVTWEGAGTGGSAAATSHPRAAAAGATTIIGATTSAKSTSFISSSATYSVHAGSGTTTFTSASCCTTDG